MIYVGMDIHKKTTTFCAVDEAGQVIRRGTVSSGEAGWLGIMGHWSRGEAAVALETGSMTWWVVDVLREASKFRERSPLHNPMHWFPGSFRL